MSRNASSANKLLCSELNQKNITTQIVKTKYKVPGILKSDMKFSSVFPKSVTILARMLAKDSSIMLTVWRDQLECFKGHYAASATAVILEF